MSKKKTLIIAVVALLLLNVSLLVIGGIKRPPGPMKDGGLRIKHIVAEKLNFDQTQLASYDELIADHQKKIKKQEELMRTAKDKLYGNLSIDDQVVKQQMMLQISEAKSAIEQIHYDHFIDIKNLCKDSQLIHFNELQSELGRLFRRGPPVKK